MHFNKNKFISYLCGFIILISVICLPNNIFANADTNLSPVVWIDTPTQQANLYSLNNKINIGGWSINGNGVQKVQVYLDNSYKGDANIGVSRPDVYKIYPKYAGSATSGYNFSLDISSIPDGNHTITVNSIGNDGVVTTKSISVKKVSSQTILPLLCIDTPVNNSKDNGNSIYVGGWSLNLSSVKNVQASIDGGNVQSAMTGISRPDVAKVYPIYNSSNSGFGMNLSISNISYGEHTLTVTTVGNDGSTKSSSVQFYKLPAVNNILPAITTIDTPIQSGNVYSLNNKIDVGGWSVNSYGIEKVQVYLDNNYKGDASIGVQRPDVGKIYSSYIGASTSGYNYALDISSISNGNHTLTVNSIGNDGSISSKTINITKISTQTKPSIVCVDTPNYSQTNNNEVTVAGWSLNLYGVQKVQVYLDNNYKGDASIGGVRQDVNNVYPGYTNGLNSGYGYSLNLTGLSVGVHTITVKSIGNDGSVTSTNAEIYKLSTNTNSMNSIMCLDTPTDGKFYKNQPGGVYIAGWSLDAFGVKKIQVYFDGKYQVDASIGGLRPDVNTVYPGYTGGGQSGFSTTLNLSNISDGVHTITVNSTGNDGKVSTDSIKIYKFSYNGQSTLYNISLQTAVNDQMQYGSPVVEINNSWMSASASTVQYYLDPTNFMDSYGIYQFLRLDYMQGVTTDDLNNILAGKGVLAGKGAQFLAAAQQSNINPVYLVSHALLETGNGTSALANGIVVNGRTTYNLFGIGAYDSNPKVYGSEYAYNQGWFSVDQAIYGGAKWISGDYINNASYKQNTLYKMRWNPASPANHQYATDVRWAYNQVTNIKTLIDKVQNPVLQFDVPQYK